MLASRYFFLIITIMGCTSYGPPNDATVQKKSIPHSFDAGKLSVISDTPGPSVLREVPVLCYHQVRDWKKTDSKNARSYIMPPDKFKKQIAMLLHEGYHFILPNELVAYMTTGKKLPPNPLILTFDDATTSEYSEALPELNRHKIKAVFFVMTVVLNRPGYMTALQVKSLADQGHVIGCHTWDHHDVRSYGKNDWKLQLEDPKNQLEKITGKPVRYFAYPYGAWNKSAIEALRNNSFIGAFQLAGRRDNDSPLYTIRRLIVDGNWNEQQLLDAIKRSFK